MAEKRDWLGTCNDQGVPLEDFQRQFCARCLQPECTRSQHGQSQFDARVANWEDRFFHSVPQMDESDPRFQQIRAKRFLGIDTSGPAVVQGWVDPLKLEEAPALPAEPAMVPPPEPVPTYEVPEAKQVEARAVADLEEQGPAPVEAQEASAPRRPTGTPMNTPNQPRQMVGGKKVDEQPTVSVSDPWKAPTPAKAPDGTKVVPPGAKIRLGNGSGV
jgi:hypothetical protein